MVSMKVSRLCWTVPQAGFVIMASFRDLMNIAELVEFRSGIDKLFALSQCILFLESELAANQGVIHVIYPFHSRRRERTGYI